MKTLLYLKLILSIFTISIFSCSCKSKKIKEATNQQSINVEALQVKASYTSYQAAMGSGKGLLFNIQIITDQQVGIDSLIIGGKAMNYTLLNNNPITLESNYFVSRPEPSEANPNPKLPNDALIDQKEFNPAYLILKMEKRSNVKLSISQFTNIKN